MSPDGPSDATRLIGVITSENGWNADGSLRGLRVNVPLGGAAASAPAAGSAATAASTHATPGPAPGIASRHASSGFCRRPDSQPHAVCLSGARAQDSGLRQTGRNRAGKSGGSRIRVYLRSAPLILGSGGTARDSAPWRSRARLGISASVPRIRICPGGDDVGFLRSI